MQQALKEAARSYVEYGWSVIPLHTMRGGVCSCGRVCGSPGKHPVAKLVPHGLKDATRMVSTVESWWDQMPDANIGIVTGQASNLWVLDLDAQRSIQLGDGVLEPEGEYSIRMAEERHGNLPETMMVQTGGGGVHYYFLYPGGGLYGNRHALMPSVDVRGEGGYVMAPPSLHPSGNQYRWVEGAAEPVLPPSWLVNWQSVPPVSEGVGFHEQTRVEQGGRNEYLFKYAASLRGQGYDENDLSNAVAQHNRDVCLPPVSDAEVRQIVKSALRYAPNPPEIELDIGPQSEDVPTIEPGADLAIRMDHFLANPPAPLIPLVGGGLLDQGDGFIIGGAPGVGKSWLAFDLALAVASGGMWLDKFPTTQGRVLICDAESGARSLYDRLQMLLAGNPFYQDGQENIFLRPEAQIKLDNPQGLVTIQRMMERYRPALVIFDTMVRFHAGDENSTREMAAFFALSQSLKVAYNSAILFTHHVRKPMKDEAGDECNLLRGSSDIRGWPEGVLLVKPHGNDGTQITLDHCKSRNHEKQPDFIVGRIIDSHDGTARLGYQGQK